MAFYCYCADMKAEVGSFTVVSSPMTVLLDDDTINIKAIHFSVSSTDNTQAEASTGFTDGTRHRSKSTLVNSTKRVSRRSTTYAITHYKDVSGTVTRKIAGKPTATGLATAGEFELEFDNFDVNQSIDYLVVGD